MEIWWKSGSKRLSVSTQKLGENSDREYRLGVATRKGGKKEQSR